MKTCMGIINIQFRAIVILEKKERRENRIGLCSKLQLLSLSLKKSKAKMT